ncbi:MAG: DUF3987 domain-containing protein, partial [Paracoccaceae bacterium]|nr:DUF3987 domain-containing protein [Paracoccaceae bacterium]
GQQVVSETAANWVLGAAEVKGAPPDYVFGSMIAVAGSLIGNSRWSAPWGGWEEPPVIWMVLVGTPSSGKSPAMGPLLKILNERDRAERREASAALDAWKDKIELAREVEQTWKSACRSAISAGAELPARPAAAKPGGPSKYTRHVINDATVEKIAALMADQVRGSLLVRDELAGWLTGMNRYSNGGSDRPFYLEAYGGRSFAVERIGRESVYIDRLSLCVLGGIQPDRFQSILLSADDDGDRGQEARGGPALPVRLFGELRPEGLDGGQPQLVEHDAEAGFVDELCGFHACCSAIVEAPTRAS